MKRICSLLLSACLIFGLCSCGQNTQEAWQEQYDLGMRYLSEGNYEEAIIAFTAAIEIDPRRVEAYGSLSDTYMVMGEYEKATEVWQRAPLQESEETLLTAFAAREKQYKEIRAALENGETGVWITGMAFDRESLLAGEETVFRLTVLCNAPEGGSCIMSGGANVENPDSRKWLTEEIQVNGGVSMKQVEMSVVPVHWESRYFCVAVDLWDEGEEEMNWDWLGGDTWYFTPEGEAVDHYAPLNAYGATEFIYRNRYRPFEEFTPEEQDFIETLASAAVAGDTGTMEGLLGFSFENYSGCTMWNGYKLECYSSGEALTEDGDRSVSLNIQIRPENGTGYYYSIQHIDAVAALAEDGWSDAVFIDVISCPCVDWQWNGTFTETDVFYHYHTWSDGGTCNSTDIKTTRGTMADGLRQGTFTTERRETEVWSGKPHLNKDTTTKSTLVYQDGVLLEEDGQAVEPDGVRNLRNAICRNIDEVSMREEIYW